MSEGRVRGRKARNYVGLRFGHFVVVERVCENGKLTRFIKCRCDCGKVVSRTVAALHAFEKRYEAGLPTGNMSCGCLPPTRTTPPVSSRYQVSVGDVFGSLTVVDTNYKHKIARTNVVKCECSCGRIVYSTPQSLIQSNGTDCGDLIHGTSRGRKRGLDINSIEPRK